LFLVEGRGDDGDGDEDGGGGFVGARVACCLRGEGMWDEEARRESSMG
jgi:hypothetical protein